MVSNTSSMSGIAYPSDLALLKQVFDRVCAEAGISVSSMQAERLSVSVMALFSDGEFDEAVLYERLKLDARSLPRTGSV
ncbi:MAG: hypothetical protein E5X48_24350 [Mesorhizobium sp.]|uniref:Uncharacterized protein n=1 Tax=Mesorhizobium muleiense TaxID=1004279 RepID=A0A1G9IS17_9HYPH|nr:MULTISPECIES: hypothetical protein [Mesorhizobium]RUV91761.1 hypothetical protein EOA88_10000 [Mesorhizobium sp. M5C.F.Ca.IN.020.14.1.1]RVC63001.1 hypothetical protein EN779_06180 [Mesorhizobium sp. M4B.F.Ca.ET.088.02.2.1]RVD71744.1 hypothetical protein EN751_13735 [Mesorhizobium sp. M4A.F.Ca.ET.029.04.2.1]AZN97883.1 hypothetical protein EJ066_11615 [Mesorhizobium sp. M9A.F.Ca.ET.002.03.1.2]AZO19702.1 hypothetical protein EJ070_02785 [Mesorhizobium sp. M1E.F.Ca.ET.045.02.1.1]